MANIKLMHGKLHRVRVTECNLDYMGSLSIDEDWLNLAGFFPLEEIHVCNVTNGNRFCTYAIPATKGSHIIGPNGACAHLCDPDDQILIYSYNYLSRKDLEQNGHTAKVLIFGDEGELIQIVEQTAQPSSGEAQFSEKIIFESSPEKI